MKDLNNNMTDAGVAGPEQIDDQLFREALLRAIEHADVRDAMRRALQELAPDGSMQASGGERHPVMSIPNVASLNLDARSLSRLQRVGVELHDPYERILEVEHPAWIMGFGRLTFVNTVRALRDANIPLEAIFDSSYWQTTSDSWRSYCLEVLDRFGLLRSRDTG